MSVVAPRDRLVMGAVGALTLLAALATATPDPIGVFFDDGLYLLIAKAVAEGQGLVYPQLPGHPPAIHYPPAFPLLLAALWRIAPPFPDSVVWFKLVNPVLLALAAMLAFRVARSALGWPTVAAAAVVLAGFVSVPTLTLGSVLFSEPLFLLLLFATLLAAAKAIDGGTRDAAVAGLLAGLLVLTRTLGVAVVPALALALALERKWPALGVLLGACAAVILPWQWYVWRHTPGFPDLLRGTYGPYLPWVLDGYRREGAGLVMAVVTQNLRDGWQYLGLQFGLLVRVLRPGFAALALGLSVAGLWSGVRHRTVRVVVFSAATYLALIIAWPYQVDRFLAGAWPFLLILPAVGVAGLVQRVSRARARLATLVAGAVLLLGHVAASTQGLLRGYAGSASRQMAARIVPALETLAGSSTPLGGVLASDLAPALALHTGATVLSLDQLLVTDHLRAKSVDERARYVAALDRQYTPDAYVLLPGSPSLPALVRADRGSDRPLRESTPAGSPVRVFLLDSR